MSVSSSIQEIIYNDSAVQSLVDTFTSASTVRYMVFSGSLLPDEVIDDSGINVINAQKSTINHYRSSGVSLGGSVEDITYVLSCRSYTEDGALSLQRAAADALNRVKSSDGLSFFICTMLPILSPADKTDNYNAPLEVRAKTKNKNA